MKCTEKIRVAPPLPSRDPQRFAWRRTNLRAVSDQFQNKHAFLDPRGWSIFPRPALHEDTRDPRSLFDAHRFFLREIEYQRHSRLMSAFAGERKGFAESLL
jgi:hypothetical protein